MEMEKGKVFINEIEIRLPMDGITRISGTARLTVPSNPMSRTGRPTGIYPVADWWGANSPGLDANHRAILETTANTGMDFETASLSKFRVAASNPLGPHQSNPESLSPSLHIQCSIGVSGAPRPVSLSPFGEVS